jgi:hypothetical protein
MSDESRVSFVSLPAIGSHDCSIRFWTTLRIFFAVLIGLGTISAGPAEPSEATRNDRGQPQLAVAPFLEVESSVPTEFFVAVGGPTDALPPNSYVQINKLPASVILSEGKKTQTGDWVVPVMALERLRITALARVLENVEFVISLMGGDGTLLVERTIALYVGPPVVAARTEPRVNETQTSSIAPSTASPVASTAAERAVSSDRPGWEGMASTPTGQKRAQAERLLSQGKRHLAEGNISNARQYFLRAVELGLAVAALKMAETHDPRALAGMNVHGIVLDPVEVRKWYERALELGVPEAQARLQQLGRQ